MYSDRPEPTEAAAETRHVSEDGLQLFASLEIFDFLACEFARLGFSGGAKLCH